MELDLMNMIAAFCIQGNVLFRNQKHCVREITACVSHNRYRSPYEQVGICISNYVEPGRSTR